MVQNDLDSFLSGTHTFFNDLEKAAFAIRPELHLLKNSLLEGGFETVLMSGSGSSFFCFGDGTLPKQSDLSVFPASFISRSLNSWY